MMKTKFLYFTLIYGLMAGAIFFQSCSQAVNFDDVVVDTTNTSGADSTDTTNNSNNGSAGKVDVTQNNVDIQKIVDLVNAQRISGCTCGSEEMPPVAAIVWNTQLADAAFGHSKDMFDNNYFSHTSQNGDKFTDRIRATGYDYFTAGENIAFGYSAEEAVVEAWLKSDGHCKNIMNSSFTEMGVGKADTYWTQVFAKPK